MIPGTEAARDADELRSIRERVRSILHSEGYGTGDGRIEVCPDPQISDVWAVQVIAPWDLMHFLIHLDDEPGEQVEEVEFKSWPPREPLSEDEI